MFAHAVPPVPLDGWWARLIEVVVLGGGIGLAAAGILRMRRAAQRTPARAEEPADG